MLSNCIFYNKPIY